MSLCGVEVPGNEAWLGGHHDGKWSVVNGTLTTRRRAGMDWIGGPLDGGGGED